MNLDGLVFVTSNLEKRAEAEAVLGRSLAHRSVELDEIQSIDLEAVVRHKAEAARSLIAKPVLVEDTALELRGLNGFPGPLVKWLLEAVGPGGISRLVGPFGDRRAVVRCLFCAADGADRVFGLGVVEGRIATEPRGRFGFGWDSVFIPDTGGGQTYAEMLPDAKNGLSHRRLALEDLKARL